MIQKEQQILFMKQMQHINLLLSVNSHFLDSTNHMLESDAAVKSEHQ
jgi:hypothetical protein